MKHCIFSLERKRKREILEENFENTGFDKLQKCFKDTLQVYAKSVQYDDIESLYSGERLSLIDLSRIISELRMVKVQMIFSTKFRKADTDMEYYFHTNNTALLSMELVDELLEKGCEEITNQVDQLTARGSGWILEKVFNIEIRVAKYVPQSGGCTTVNLPEWLKQSHSLIFLKCNQDCFMNSILATLHPEDIFLRRAFTSL